MKQLIQDKKGHFLSFIIGSLILITIVLVGFASYEKYKINNNDCLKELAKEFCWEKGFVFSGMDLDLLDYPTFSCHLDERHLDKIKYRLLDEEIEMCVNGN